MQRLKIINEAGRINDAKDKIDENAGIEGEYRYISYALGVPHDASVLCCHQPQASQPHNTDHHGDTKFHRTPHMRQMLDIKYITTKIEKKCR